jgi:hypothetical protein
MFQETAGTSKFLIVINYFAFSGAVDPQLLVLNPPFC